MQQMDDYEQVRQLYAVYARTLDTDSYDEWIACFCDDAVFETPRWGRFTGHDGLRKFVRLYRDSLGGARVRHMICNVIFRLSGDDGEGSCDLMYYQTKNGHTELKAVGGYDDTLRKVGEHWQFASRRIVIDTRI